MNVCVGVCVYACLCANACVRTYACVCVYMCVCICMFVTMCQTPGCLLSSCSHRRRAKGSGGQQGLTKGRSRHKSQCVCREGGWGRGRVTYYHSPWPGINNDGSASGHHRERVRHLSLSRRGERPGEAWKRDGDE